MVCSFVKGKDMLLGSKVNIIEKHVGKTKAIWNMLDLGKKKGEWYYNKKWNHAKNQVVYFKHNCIWIVEQIQRKVKGE